MARECRVPTRDAATSVLAPHSWERGGPRPPFRERPTGRRLAPCWPPTYIPGRRMVEAACRHRCRVDRRYGLDNLRQLSSASLDIAPAARAQDGVTSEKRRGCAPAETNAGGGQLPPCESIDFSGPPFWHALPSARCRCSVETTPGTPSSRLRFSIRSFSCRRHGPVITAGVFHLLFAAPAVCVPAFVWPSAASRRPGWPGAGPRRSVSSPASFPRAGSTAAKGRRPWFVSLPGRVRPSALGCPGSASDNDGARRCSSICGAVVSEHVLG